MKRYVSVSEIKNEMCHCGFFECHRLVWKDGSSWSGYEKTPRFADGITIVNSQISLSYELENGEIIAARKGDILYMPKGSRYITRSQGGGSCADLYTINFSLTDKACNELHFSKNVKMLAGPGSPACRYIANELADAVLTLPDNKLKQQARFFALLDAIADSIAYRSPGYYPIRNGVQLFLQEWNKSEKIAKYASLCDMSESSFYFYFRQWSGMSPNEYRNQIRISAAKSMLGNTALPIYEIAVQAGFDDPYYFSRVFKKELGISPREYRVSCER